MANSEAHELALLLTLKDRASKGISSFVKQAMDDLRDQRYAKWRGGVGGADDDAETEM